jgi:hypothetical protein
MLHWGGALADHCRLMNVTKSAQRCSLPFAVDPLRAVANRTVPASIWPTSPLKTRVWGLRCNPSGRMSRRSRFRSMLTPGSRACAYKTASGRGEWPNQDPVGEFGGINLYALALNDPMNRVDPLGLQLLPSIPGTWPIPGANPPSPEEPKTPPPPPPGWPSECPNPWLPGSPSNCAAKTDNQIDCFQCCQKEFSKGTLKKPRKGPGKFAKWQTCNAICEVVHKDNP